MILRPLPTMDSISSLKPYEIERVVDSKDIDLLGHVNNVVYLKWVQDIAIAHWNHSATDEQKATLLWVVAKHEIEYKRPALESDILIIRTWVGKATDRLFERHTEVVRKADGKLVAKAVSLWAPIDKESKRRVRIGADLYEMFST